MMKHKREGERKRESERERMKEGQSARDRVKERPRGRGIIVLLFTHILLCHPT
jgi:hypothetical protein